MRVALLAFMMMSCGTEDTRATKACTGSGSASQCHACCKAQGDRNYMFREHQTTKYCMCQFGR